MDKTQRETAVFSNPHQYVRTIAAGDAVHTLLAVGEASRKEARNGPFWMLNLKDATGALAARVWSPLALRFEDIPTGSLVEVEGRAERYREQLQLSVSSLRVLDPEEAAAMDTSAFMPSSARSPLLMVEELEALADDVLTHAPWRNFIRRVLRDEDVRQRLLKAPAARGIHHARVGGLLEHTLGVVRLCLHFAELYPQLDRQALFAGAVCHDLGKLWELSGGLSIEYTDEGRLAGHIFLGLGKLMPHAEAALLGPDQVLHLQHLILSHHGQYEFGSPRLPQTAEAFALHYADNMDAKMDQCRNLFADMAPEESAWSPFQKTLERAVFRAPRTPLAENGMADAQTDGPDDLSGDMPDDLPPDDLPPDDMPDEVADDLSGDAADEVAFEAHTDLPDETVDGFPAGPAPDFPDDPGPDALVPDAVDPFAVLSDDECVFEHITDAACIGETVAMAEANRQEPVLPDMSATVFAASTATEPVPEAVPQAVPRAVSETVTPTLPETASEAASEAVTPTQSAAHPRQEKTRLEVRQCSLL